jgi:hypothetical protein
MECQFVYWAQICFPVLMTTTNKPKFSIMMELLGSSVHN